MFPVIFSFGKKKAALRVIRGLGKRKQEHPTQVRCGVTNYMIPFQKQAKSTPNNSAFCEYGKLNHIRSLDSGFPQLTCFDPL